MKPAVLKHQILCLSCLLLGYLQQVHSLLKCLFSLYQAISRNAISFDGHSDVEHIPIKFIFFQMLNLEDDDFEVTSAAAPDEDQETRHAGGSENMMK